MQSDPSDLVARVVRAGHGPEEVERAAAEGRLPGLAVQSALGGGAAEFTLSDVARSSGLRTAFVRELMQALGRPNPGRGERAFSQEDADLARLVNGFLDAGLPRSELLEVLRVLSRGMAQTAEATRRLVGNALLERGVSQDEVALRYIDAAERLAPGVIELLRLQLRAHLRTGISQELVSDAERVSGRLNESREVAVAFADLVDYTRLGGQLPPEDVGRIAGRMAELAADTVRRPVTLVKMIGDAAMFVSDDADALVTVVDRLTQRIAAEGPDYPGVRAGIAFGPATTRGGDWFGATVNLASRVAGLAKPGQILATEEIEQRASGVTWERRRRRRKVKGIDERVRLYSVVPTD
jgi:adenylate cyclase